MNPENFRLLIHHHHVAHVDNAGEIWLTSAIARWVLALSTHFKEIGLLLHQSAKPLPGQDTPISRKNVRLFSLGPPGYYWDYLPRLRRIREVCRHAGPQADGLLIRGLTPRQHTVWLHTPGARKAFLLVRSPRQPRLIKIGPKEILSAGLNKFREFEFRQIAKKNNIVVMANSPAYIPEIEVLTGHKAFFVPTNTIQEEEISPLHVRPVGIPFKLLYVGRLNFLKGLRELFCALAVLHQQGQRCVLDLVGDLDEPVYPDLVKLADQLGITNLIYWHGFVPYGPELFKYYLNADSFVLPTYTEGFPHVLREAVANCCPVITTSVGGIPAIFEHEKHALLIPPKDVDSIVNAVKRLITETTLRQKLIGQAYHQSMDFTVEACAQKLAATLSMAWE
jgi:glycosyltransferase involved in cell wall biosynthesis